MTLAKSAAEQLLVPFFDAIRQAIESGIADYDSLPAHQLSTQHEADSCQRDQ